MPSISPEQRAELRRWNNADVNALLDALDEAERDTKRIDYLADTRVFDGLGDCDIDEMTLAAVYPDSTEETWKLEWRKQLRIAIEKLMAAEAHKGER